MPLDPKKAEEIVLAAKQSERREDFGSNYIEKTLKAQCYRSWGSTVLAHQLGETIQNLNFIQRGPALDRISGKLRPVYEKAVKKGVNLCYQQGFSRQPFRAPNDPYTRAITLGILTRDVVRMRDSFDRPIEWYAEMCGFLADFSYTLTCDEVMGLAIDQGNEKVLNTLIESIEGTHPIGIISQSGIRALLRSDHPRAWSAIEKLLVNAGANEGLRQVIVECAPELHPEVFKRLLRLIVEHNLIRFSAIIRAFIVWFPGLIEENKPQPANKVLMRVLEFLSNPTLKAENTSSDVYLRLWCDALVDIQTAIKAANKCLDSTDVEVRIGAARLISKLRNRLGIPVVRRLLTDSDLRVKDYGVDYVADSLEWGVDLHDLQDDFILCAQKWPAKVDGKEISTRRAVWSLALNIEKDRKIEFFAENLTELDSEGRYIIANNIKGIHNAELRKKVLLSLAGDTSDQVRSKAFTHLESLTIAPEEAIYIESLLSRKAAGLRKSALTLLYRQKKEQALESAARLTASKDKLQQAAGSELESLLNAEKVKIKLENTSYFTSAPRAEIIDDSDKNFFGLIKPEDIRFYGRPTKYPPIRPFIDEVKDIYIRISNLIEENKDMEISNVEFKLQYDEDDTKLRLCDMDYRRFFHSHYSGSYDAKLKQIPLLQEVRDMLFTACESKTFFESFYISRRIIGGSFSGSNNMSISAKVILKQYFSEIPNHLAIAHGMISLFALKIPCKLESINNIIGHYILHHKEFLSKQDTTTFDWRFEFYHYGKYNLLDEKFVFSSKPTIEELKDHYEILRYLDEPLGQAGRERVEEGSMQDQFRPRFAYSSDLGINRKVPTRMPIDLSVIDEVYNLGICNESEFFDAVRFYFRTSTENHKKWSPKSKELLRKAVRIIVDIESRRGELSSPATKFAGDTCGFIELDSVLKILATNVPFLNATSWENSLPRSESFSRLLSHSRPGPDDTHEKCVAAFRELNIKPERLVELAMLSPHWGKSVEAAIGWTGLEDAIWWLFAHTKDDTWGYEREKAAEMFGHVSERTGLTAEEFQNGSCDPQWYWRFRHNFTEKQWKTLEKCAKFNSTSNGHTRALLFAKALDGKLTVAEILENMRTKRNQNYVRALGLVPLSANPGTDIVERYIALQEYMRISRTFGAMRQASDKLAFEIAMDNLAGTAGYVDRMRLTWALEADSIKDMISGELNVTQGDLSVKLVIDELGLPQILVEKGGKPLKEIPASAKKTPEVKTLTDRRTQLKKQQARMKLGLEQAMQRGDLFQKQELEALNVHPVLKPLTSNLLFVNSKGDIGFPDEIDGQDLRVAHPADLLASGKWPELQKRIFLEERVQPFKQVFREHYVLTDAEKEQTTCTRFAGHQVKPGQAMAILGKRGWLARAYDGVTRTFYKEGIVVWLGEEFNIFSPADIEGITLTSITFMNRTTYEPIPLADIPPIIFSEVLRDIDLIVSVANVTGYDPEASESTVEMRARVIEQTASLLGLTNITLGSRNVKIEGEYGSYSVNLSSAQAYQEGRGALVIIAVRQPQRGRIFLPFADDDPRTAEIVSKTILLARDKEIKDPTILGQIVGVRL